MDIKECISIIESWEEILDFKNESIKLLKNIRILQEHTTDQVSENFDSLMNNLFLKVEENNKNIQDFLLKKDDSYSLKNKITELMAHINVALEYLLVFQPLVSSKERNIIIVGANGSGKTTYISGLKNLELLSNVVVIPAQNWLFFNDNSIKRFEMSIDKYNNDIASSPQKYLISENYEKANNDKVLDSFTYLISAFLKNYYKVTSNRYLKDQNTVPLSTDETLYYDQFIDVWNSLNLEIEILPNTDTGSIVPRKNGIKYELNDMSDGEKSIIFYILRVLVAPQNSYIIVDEPETHLNVSVVNQLWNKLLSIRGDCQFIFASHNIDFINSIKDASIHWISNFKLPSNFEFKKIEDTNSGLPFELITTIVGSKKPILFCEGKLNSYDYKIYNALFGDEYVIKPVDGHDEVISYTKALNYSDFSQSNKNIGIIDGDNYWDEDQVEDFKKLNIYVLPHNEIEMLLIDEDLLKAVVSQWGDSNLIFKNFKKEFFKVLKKEIAINSLMNLKFIVDKKMVHTKISKPEDIDDFINQYNERFVTNDFLKEKYNDNLNRLNQIIEQEDYGEALKICNLKNSFNQIIDRLNNKYREAVVVKIENDSDLKRKIKQKIFEHKMTIN